MARIKKQHLDQLVQYLKHEDRAEPSLKDVVTLAELTADSLQVFYSRLDRDIHSELVEIANYITSMKREIAALGVNDLRNERLPSAGQELDAIVKSTEEATNTIMEQAEALMAADPGDPDAMYGLVQDASMKIFEACSFQDLTGQRIARVVETLQAIESRVSRFASAVRVQEETVPVSEEEMAREARKAALILNGPQNRGVAMEQNDIDAILNGSKPQKADVNQDAIDHQCAIDRMFN